MADAGGVAPLYHGNEAETDLKPVGDIELNCRPRHLLATANLALAAIVPISKVKSKHLIQRVKPQNCADASLPFFDYLLLHDCRKIQENRG